MPDTPKCSEAESVENGSNAQQDKKYCASRIRRVMFSCVYSIFQAPKVRNCTVVLLLMEAAATAMVRRVAAYEGGGKFWCSPLCSLPSSHFGVLPRMAAPNDERARKEHGELSAGIKI